MKCSDVCRLSLLGELGGLANFIKEVTEECGPIEVNAFKHFVRDVV